MFEAARKILCEADYQPIGLDHFVRKDDELYTALLNGQLHRNFQGYCTRRTTGQVYAFGVTGISQLGTAYARTQKTSWSISRSRSRHLACRQRISPKPGGTDHTGGNRNVDVQLPDRLERTVGTAFRPRPLHQAGNRL